MRLNRLTIMNLASIENAEVDFSQIGRAHV